MKKFMVIVVMLSGALAQAKLSDQQSMKCIDSDRLTKSAFQDLQAAYEMRLVTAKDFFKVMEKPASCPQLKKDLKKLHASAVSSFPRAKQATRLDSSGYGNSNNSYSAGPAAPGMPPVPSFNNDGPPAPEFGDAFPPPPPDADFSADDFTDFR